MLFIYNKLYTVLGIKSYLMPESGTKNYHIILILSFK